jgi:hypothetical protein
VLDAQADSDRGLDKTAAAYSNRCATAVEQPVRFSVPSYPQGHSALSGASCRHIGRSASDRRTSPVNSVPVLLEASKRATPSETAPVVLADASVEHVNAQVDELIGTGVLRRLLAFTELKFSNSLIEAWWRSLKIG